METPPIQHTMSLGVERCLNKRPHTSLLGAFVLGLVLFGIVILTASLIRVHQRTQTAAVAASQSAFDAISLKAESAIVVDLTSGRVVYARNPDAQLPLASLTKVPLALVVSKVLPSDYSITIPYDTSAAGSAERLAKGDRWHVKDILAFTLVASSNGGADILANAANEVVRQRYPGAPDINATLWRMNQLSRELGLEHTYFLNPSGLDESATQSGAYGSARDVATLFAYAASSSPSVFASTGRDGMQLQSTDGNKTAAINTNTALGDIPGFIMGKTGYTDLAGGNLAIVFDVGIAHPVAVVVMHSTRDGRFDDMKKLVSAARATITP